MYSRLQVSVYHLQKDHQRRLWFHRAVLLMMNQVSVCLWMRPAVQYLLTDLHYQDQTRPHHNKRKMPSSLRLPTQFQDIRENRERTLERRTDDRTDTRGVGTRRAGANVDRDASAARQPTAAAAASSTRTESGVAQPAKGQMTQSGSTRPPLFACTNA